MSLFLSQSIHAPSHVCVDNQIHLGGERRTYTSCSTLLTGSIGKSLLFFSLSPRLKYLMHTLIYDYGNFVLRFHSSFRNNILYTQIELRVLFYEIPHLIQIIRTSYTIEDWLFLFSLLPLPFFFFLSLAWFTSQGGKLKTLLIDQFLPQGPRMRQGVIIRNEHMFVDYYFSSGLYCAGISYSPAK